MSRHVDDNLATLNKHLNNQEKLEAHYEDFTQAVLAEIQDEVYDLEVRYNLIAAEYDIDTLFSTFMVQEIL